MRHHARTSGPVAMPARPNLAACADCKPPLRPSKGSSTENPGNFRGASTTKAVAGPLKHPLGSRFLPRCIENRATTTWLAPNLRKTSGCQSQTQKLSSGHRSTRRPTIEFFANQPNTHSQSYGSKRGAWGQSPAVPIAEFEGSLSI